MPTTDELGHEVTPAPSFARLRDRTWGIRVFDAIDRTGQTITVRRHSTGESTDVRLTQRVALYRSDTRPALYRFEDIAPRPSDSASGPQNGASGAALPTPVASNRTGRMLLAGGITCTITCPDGQHVTLRISSRRRSGRGWANCQPTDEGARVSIRAGRQGVRIGRILSGWQLQMFGASPHVRDAIHRLFDVASGADCQLIGGRLALSDGFRIQVADCCGRCGRELTDPVSIDRGIGLECWGHSTGSHHAPVTGAVSTDTAAPAPAPAATGSISDLMADFEDEADAWLAQNPPADDPADAPADDVTTADAAPVDSLGQLIVNRPPATPAPTIPEWMATMTETGIVPAPADDAPAITGADIAQARNAMQAAFRSRTPRQLRALELFDQLAAHYSSSH